MIPGLAVEDLEARHFLVAVRPRCHQGHIPLLRKDQQQVLIGQEQHLAVAVAAGFPFRPGRFVQAYADEKAGVEAVDVLAMDDQVVEVGLDGGRLPNLARRPAIALARDADQPLPKSKLVPINPSRSLTTVGWMARQKPCWTSQSCCQRTWPLTGSSDVSPASLRMRICSTPCSRARCVEE